MDLRGWINSGLMTFFFFVIGLEARREFDLGELRERRRVALPLLAGIGGMASRPDLPGDQRRPALEPRLGNAMSTDTAFALGCSRSSGRGLPDRLRAFLLTVAVVDDIVALLVIATAYSGAVSVVGRSSSRSGSSAASCSSARPTSTSARLLPARHRRLGRVLRVRRRSRRRGLHGRRDRLAYPAQRSDLERATDLFRLFREQPTGGARADGAVGTAVGGLAERAAAVALASVDELPDRAALRARERRRPIERRLPLDRVHLAGDARDPVRLRARQADRDRRRAPGSRRSSAAAACGRRSVGRRCRRAGRSQGSASRSRS